jgi:spore maturation protein CgeB
MKLLHIGLCVSEIENGFQKAFKDVLGNENYFELSTGEQHINVKILQKFNECKPDIVFFQIQAENIVANQTFDYLKSNGAFVINWTGDKRNSIPQWMIDAAPFVSLTAFSNMEDVRELNKLGYDSKYLEIGYDENIYNNFGDAYTDYEVLFMANNYGAGYFPFSKFRIEIAENLKNKLSSFGLFGSGWLKGNGNVNHSQYEEAKWYRGCKIAINCSHYNVARYNSDRLLRILGSGAFCLSYKHPEMEEDYENYKHLVYFDSIEDLNNKIDYYLQNEDERKQIAYNGQQLVLNRNTFKHQVENIIKLAQ